MLKWNELLRIIDMSGMSQVVVKKASPALSQACPSENYHANNIQRLHSPFAHSINGPPFKTHNTVKALNRMF